MTPRRADAERNCEKILAAARDAFAHCEGSEVSMAELARRAGVGMGTLYRNFANRRELLEALYAHEVDGVCQIACVDGTPGEQLMAWLRQFFGFFSTKRQFAAALLEEADSCDDPVFANTRARVIAAGQPLLAAAQKSKEVRKDLTLEQVLDMVGAIATIPADEDYVEPILAAALDGLRTK